MSADPVQRFASVDALRGISVAAMLLVNNPGDWSHVYAPLLHARWNGCTPTDLIFPLFLFIVGVSISLSIGPRVERGANRATVRNDVLLRALRIVVLGLLLHLSAHVLLATAHFRPWGVLQRIGVCFAVAGVLAVHATPRAQWRCIGAFLAGYAALLAIGDSLEPLLNVSDRLDTAILGHSLYRYDALTGRGQDPEGLLSTLGALATTLLGLRAGDWLRRGQSQRLFIAGIGALLGGTLWSIVLPLNKALWTPSYVLWTGGICLLALAAAHALIDRRGWPAFGRRFGVNAIAAYAGSALMVYLLAASGAWQAIHERVFVAALTPRFSLEFASLAFAIAFVTTWWLIVFAMDRRGWRVRI